MVYLPHNNLPPDFCPALEPGALLVFVLQSATRIAAIIEGQVFAAHPIYFRVNGFWD